MSADTTEEDWETCPECGDTIDPDDSVDHHGDAYHGSCLRECEGCGGAVLSSDTVTTTGRYRSSGETYCNDCAFTCDGCNETRPMDEAHTMYNHYETGCDECAGYCESCDEYVWSDYVFYSDRDGCTYCEDCYEDRESGEGIRGYGHTRPTQWLGGPLPRNEAGEHVGYYVGFELEVGSNPSDGAMPVHAWAAKHMAPDALDCKTDSSIEYGPYADGFEIATQPMTPAFFESVPWESLMDTLEDLAPMEGRPEPKEHGLHVHIGRVAFRRDDVAIAMFCYLLAQDSQGHLTRIARRDPYHYCNQVKKPVSASIVKSKPHGAQGMRLRRAGVYAGRDAINLENPDTIEIRSFRSTRSAKELREAVRVVYLAADYVMYLRTQGFVSPRSLHWEAFAAWVKTTHRDAYKSIRGPKATRQRKAA